MEFAFIPYMTIQNIITKLTGAVMMFVSVLLYLNGSMSLMICIGMTICAFMLYSSLEQAGSYSALLRTIDICIDKAQKILDLDTMDIDGKDIIPQNYDIDVNNIEFSYDKRKIIDGISLHIPQRPQPQLSARQAEANQPFAILFQGFGMLTEVISDWAVLMYGNTVWTAL